MGNLLTEDVEGSTAGTPHGFLCPCVLNRSASLSIFFHLGITDLNAMQSRASHLNSIKNLGDFEIRKMRFGIRSHLAMTSIIRLPHICCFKSKNIISCEVKWQQKGGEGREEIKIFSLLLFNLFVSHVAKSLSFRSNRPRYTCCWATVAPLRKASPNLINMLCRF